MLNKIERSDKRECFNSLTAVEQEGKRFVRGIQMAVYNSDDFAKFKAGFTNPLSWQKT